VKLEIETLLELIYTNTQTPNISFSQMKGLGNLSGVALKLMFMDAHMKVENKIEILGEMFQRRLNLLKAMCGKVADSSLEEAVKTLTVEPVFTPYLPRNEKEELETLNIGAGGKAVMSQKTAVKNNPYVQDSEAEMEQIKEEENNAATRQTFEY
jgi:SPP1 family phage portal protein